MVGTRLSQSKSPSLRTTSPAINGNGIHHKENHDNDGNECRSSRSARHHSLALAVITNKKPRAMRLTSGSGDEEEDGNSSYHEETRSSSSSTASRKSRKSTDDDDNSSWGFSCRRSARQLEKQEQFEKQSWVVGGGPSAKGYPTRSGRMRLDSANGDTQVNTSRPSSPESSRDEFLENADSQDMYTRLKKRRGGARKASQGSHYSPRKTGPGRPGTNYHLRVRKPKIYNDSKNKNPTSASERRKLFRRLGRRQSSDKEDSTSSDEEYDPPKKKKPKLCANANDGSSQSFIGSRELYEPLKPDPTITFESVGGLDEFICKLREVILFPMMYRRFYESRGIRPPRGVLFYGPPGTGKTLMARAIANEASINNGRQVSFFMLKGSDILSKWVGESEKAVKQVFESAASRQPSIIFFDEIDGLAASRSVKTDQFHNSLVSTFLAELDGVRDRGQVIVIGATNRIDAIDPAFRRAGRFDYELQFRLPDYNARQAILNIHTSTWPDPPSEHLLIEVATMTAGYNGADLKLMCSEACLNALRRCYPQIYKRKERLSIDYDRVQVCQDDFAKAMEHIPRSSARSTTSIITTGIPLPLVLKPLLQNSVNLLQDKVAQVFPYKTPAIRQPSCKRLMVFTDCEFIVPAVLHEMDSLPIIVINIQTLSTAESESRTIISAFSEASNKPGVIFIPDIDVVYSMLGHHGKIVLQRELRGLDTSLLIATSNNEHVPNDLAEYFQDCTVEVQPSTKEERTEFFQDLFNEEALKVRVDLPEEEEEELEVVEMEDLTEEDLRITKKYEEKKLRELRIFLRETLEKLARNKMFTEFTEPVDVKEVPDYTEIIKNPMDFETMMCKVNSGKYYSSDMFMADINLIVDNAIEYNPPKSQEDKKIRHRANALRDVANDIIDKELDSDFEEDCIKIEKAIKEREGNLERKSRPKSPKPKSILKKAITPRKSKSPEANGSHNVVNNGLGFAKASGTEKYRYHLEHYLNRLVGYTEGYSTTDLLNIRYKLLCKCQEFYTQDNKNALIRELKTIIKIVKKWPERGLTNSSRGEDYRSVSHDQTNGYSYTPDKNDS